MVSVIVPARDEAAALPRLLQQLKAARSSLFEIIVIDSASSDNTAAVAENENVDNLIRLSLPGKGRALLAGVDAAKGETLVFLDGDGSYSPRSISQLIHGVEEGGADIVYGSRFLEGSSSDIGLIRKLGNRLLGYVASLLYGVRYDFLSGFIAVRRDCVESLGLKSKDYRIEAELFAKSVRSGFRIEELPIAYKRNRTSKLKPVRDGIKILLVLIRERRG